MVSVSAVSHGNDKILQRKNYLGTRRWVFRLFDDLISVVFVEADA